MTQREHTHTKKVQTFLFPPSLWIALLNAAKPIPNTYSGEMRETLREVFYISVLKYFHCRMFCFCSPLAY